MGDAASFRGPAGAYDRHVGRYSPALARALVAKTRVWPGHRVLDVGCGPGALAAELATRVGADSVAAVDASPDYLAACRERVPGIEARVATAEALPFPDGGFDAVLSQLAVNFFTDAPRAVGEMGRVTRDGGLVAAAVWDYSGGMLLLRAYWDAVAEVAGAADDLDEGTRMRYCSPVELAELFAAAGLREVTTAPVVVSAHYDGFDDLWEALAAGGGPAGAHCRSLSPADRDAVRAAMFARLGSPSGPFDLTARAWTATGRAI